MALIEFTVVHDFDASARTVWDAMIDWPGHGDWIPMTRVEIDSGDATEVGGMFTGYTGYGPLTLVDRMRVTSIEWDDTTSRGACEVEKLGPVLTGRAGFTITGDAANARVQWFEEITVPYVPQVLAPIVNKVSAFGFSMGMRQLAKLLAKQSPPVMV